MKQLRLLLVAAICCGLSACSDDGDKPDGGVQQDLFNEGQIDLVISSPGNPILDVFVSIYQQVDPTLGNMDEQMEAAAANLSSEEIEALAAFQAAFEEENDHLGNLTYIFSMMFLPVLDNVIYVKGNEATAKFDALTYHGENRVNMSTASGQYFMQSRWYPENQISFNYTEEALYDGFAQTTINNDFYQVEHTSDTDVIAGYVCKKNVYTSIQNDVGPHKLEVWTSEFMPTSINFLHPYYLEETGGIMKITIHLLSNGDFPIVYEFVNVTSRTINETEMSIQQNSPVYDYEQDFMTIGMKLFGILFGGELED